MKKQKRHHHHSSFFLGDMEEAYERKNKKHRLTPLEETALLEENTENEYVFDDSEETEETKKVFSFRKKKNAKKKKDASDFTAVATKSVPVVNLSDNPEAIPSLQKAKEKKERAKVVPVLKGMQNPEAMPGYQKPKAEEIKPEIKEEIPEEKKPEKILTPFDPKELEEIFRKEEEEDKDFLEQSEEALQKALKKSKAWLFKQAEEADNKKAPTPLRISRTLIKKAALFIKKILPERKKKAQRPITKKAPTSQKETLLDSPEHLAKQQKVRESLAEMYEVSKNSNGRKNLKKQDIIRYAILFVCIFGFVSAGAFVFTKLYDYYRSYVVYSGLQELVQSEDFFQKEYLSKTSASILTQTPQSILNGEKGEKEDENLLFTKEQQNLVNKIGQLKNINKDTVGWIKINGTVVNYPVVWSELKNYYLHRDFYGKNLSGGTIYVDERNTNEITQNRNTVIYGHNMTDGSMFASIHDFANASTFYQSTIEITTEEGVFLYTPFSVHESDAYDNYFETDFVSDEDFINFCEQMKFISLYETDFDFDKDTRIITLSTCGKDEREKNDRFAVHAILTKVIR